MTYPTTTHLTRNLKTVVCYSFVLQMMSKLTVLLFLWLGHGYISPFLELAKALNDSDRFSVYICSTAANLVFVKKTLRNKRLSFFIKVIELLLPELTDLPSELYFNNGLPLHFMHVLKQAFDLSSPRFLEVLEDLSPDLLIYDILQSWALRLLALEFLMWCSSPLVLLLPCITLS
ncbi:hypothetical protein Tco_1217881 [Tanacetum coccineum]